ncbi:hypothetical protein BOTBODRAFT_115654 [Botryobasidium botryosum FD-172 SS1]|uniref:Carboxylic ester hydrolase n=1 Tax=Botryobasidium botryosum (strain FD-172 SS1) TaxID=930990 RepID=A0A067M4R5_BOTB1|nr:hypothetical protein BOTBODRAFT_115654 [Botryobasidium botryosum FD-172 SS1]
MLAFYNIVFVLLAAQLLVIASPVPPAPSSSSPPSPVTPLSPILPINVGHIQEKLQNIACIIPLLRIFLCLNQGSNQVSVNTPLGAAKGVLTTPGVARFVVRYATAPRWNAPQPVQAWSIPNNDPTALPPGCSQDESFGFAASYSEDCLFAILYVPASLQTLLSGGIPTMVWIHGGSFIVGSATASGLDASKLAEATQSIVAVVQYRLGALGLIPPPSLGGSTNLAVKDVVQSLKFLQGVIPSFGGDPAKITIAGQSSGASMVRALLGVPTANSLFRSAIIESDPMDFGFLKPSSLTNLQNALFSSLSCSTTDTSCLNALPASAFVQAQNIIMNNGANIDPAAGQFEPIRPIVDGSFLATSQDGNSFPSTHKPLLITTVKNEAGLPIGGAYSQPQAVSTYTTNINNTLPDGRGSLILNSNFYASPATADGDAVRVALDTFYTDYFYRCPSLFFARTWSSLGGTVYTGLFVKGATYAGNQYVSYCLGKVCHQDDIYILFGTTPSPTPDQTALTKEIQARWGAFIHNANPNPIPNLYAQWAQATPSDTHTLQLGGSGEAAPGGCTPGFWGDTVKFDWEVYGQ